MFLPFEPSFTFCISRDALSFIVAKLHVEIQKRNSLP